MRDAGAAGHAEWPAMVWLDGYSRRSTLVRTLANEADSDLSTCDPSWGFKVIETRGSVRAAEPAVRRSPALRRPWGERRRSRSPCAAVPTGRVQPVAVLLSAAGLLLTVAGLARAPVAAPHLALLRGRRRARRRHAVFQTSTPFVPGTLIVFVDGIAHATVVEHPASGSFGLGWAPATGSSLEASWRERLDERAVLSVAARRDVPPVPDGVVHRLRARGAVAQRQLPVVDLAAAAVLLDVVEVAKRVLVLDLSRFLAGQRHRPVGRVGPASGSLQPGPIAGGRHRGDRGSPRCRQTGRSRPSPRARSRLKWSVTVRSSAVALTSADGPDRLKDSSTERTT